MRQPHEPPAAAPGPAAVALTCHDDWLVNVLMADGRVYTFNTELWPEHGDYGVSDEAPDQWPDVIEAAKRRAERYAAANVRTWALNMPLPITAADFRKALDHLCERTSDADFLAFLHT